MLLVGSALSNSTASDELKDASVSVAAMPRLGSPSQLRPMASPRLESVRPAKATDPSMEPASNAPLGIKTRGYCPRSGQTLLAALRLHLGRGPARFRKLSSALPCTRTLSVPTVRSAPSTRMVPVPVSTPRRLESSRPGALAAVRSSVLAAPTGSRLVRVGSVEVG
nr:hypothetical protein [Tanacetum cinerariifolium]